MKRKRRLASFRTQPYNILVRDRRDTRNFVSRCCKNIRRGNFTKTLASKTANGQETYSRFAQQSIIYLASQILKASCSCIHILHFLKHCSRGDLPCCTSSIYKLQTFHKKKKKTQWNQFLDTFPSFPNAVGLIDGTIYQIRCPSGPPQAEFYRGDQRSNFISSQIVVYTDGLIVLLVTGYSINHLL